MPFFATIGASAPVALTAGSTPTLAVVLAHTGSTSSTPIALWALVLLFAGGLLRLASRRVPARAKAQQH